MGKKRTKKPGKWFERSGGVCFECNSCGNCCKGEGHAHFRYEEYVLLIQDRPDLAPLLETVARPDGSTVHRARNVGGRCAFLKLDNTCSIYDHRPVQCQTFPFWPGNLKSFSAWERLVGEGGCEGVGQGRKVNPKTIKKDLERTEEEWEKLGIRSKDVSSSVERASSEGESRPTSES